MGKENDMAKNVIAGRYELLEKIGDGGMAVVYKARCRVLNRFVAVKILKPEYIEDQKFIESFRKESHAAASLSNPNIVNIYDVGREGNINYIVMELVEGESLSEKIQREGVLDFEEALSIARQIASGLAAAHKHKIIHRDVKPHNVLITQEGIAKIADFGIAKAVTDTTIVDKTNETIMGSVHYFSPEQARGGHMDARTDIYSLGIVLFEMVTGQVPFDGDNPVAVALKQINEPIPYPRDVNPDLPVEIEDIILNATEKKPSDRYQTINQMIADIDKYLGGYRAAAVLPNEILYEPEERATLQQTRNIDTEEIKHQNSKRKKRQVAVPPTPIQVEEYEDRPLPKKKKGKGKKIGIIIAAIVVLIAAGLATAYFSGILGGKDVECPVFVGMSIEEARDEAEKLKLDIDITGEEYSEDVASNTVLSQDPEAGTMIEQGSKVEVVVSKGSANRAVPNVVGKKKSEAKDMLENAGFKVDFRDKESPEEKGTVVEQSPEGGSEAKIDETVIVYLSDGKGKKLVKVPNLLGMSLKDAEETLKEKNLVIQHIGEGISSEYAKGEIMSQSYNAGEEVEEGTKIKVRTSKGAQVSKSYYIDYSAAENDSFKMTVKVKDEDGERTILSGVERKKAEGGQSLSIKGRGKGKITVLFDGKVVAEQNMDFSGEDVD